MKHDTLMFPALLLVLLVLLVLLESSPSQRKSTSMASHKGKVDTFDVDQQLPDNTRIK